MKYLCITLTPFIWHWPHMDRGLSACHSLRVGPFSISGLSGMSD
jgi:hypothetical protein